MSIRHQPTPDEVLAILVDQHRHQSQVDPEAEPDVVLTFDSSIAEWRSACDLAGWKSLGRALNEEWGIFLGMAEWQSLLEPADRRTLRALCEAISREAQIEELPEQGLLGCRSPEGRALRILRIVLLRLGMPREEIRTSTLVSPLLSKYGWRLLSPCLRIAPGALPPVKHVGRAHKTLWFLMALLLLSSPGFALFNSPLGTWCLCLGLGIALLLWVPHPIFRGSLLLPGIETLGELAACIAKGTGGQKAVLPNGNTAKLSGKSGFRQKPPSRN